MWFLPCPQILVCSSESILFIGACFYCCTGSMQKELAVVGVGVGLSLGVLGVLLVSMGDPWVRFYQRIHGWASYRVLNMVSRNHILLILFDLLSVALRETGFISSIPHSWSSWALTYHSPFLLWKRCPPPRAPAPPPSPAASLASHFVPLVEESC